ncbi:CABIT domain-containing protein [Caerostris extrusa]|uniref:CABIT domain-containing protein n=1 Tax=Caerostris extrusa TaxID=172846 RepID=A0AAV4XRH2_CAEEX|nr:CABIT domain-containing protein [Caerostris extrusa]
MSSLSGIKCWGEPLPPQEFLRKYGLPQIVRVFEGNRVQGPARVDLDRPLLLYKAYICQQVHARSIDRDKNGGITSVGPPLILPDTYPEVKYRYSIVASLSNTNLTFFKFVLSLDKFEKSFGYRSIRIKLNISRS